MIYGGVAIFCNVSSLQCACSDPIAAVRSRTGSDKVTVTPTANGPGATIQVQGQNTDSGKASADIALTAGEAVEIDVEVTAEDGTTKKEYKIEATEEK